MVEGPDITRKTGNPPTADDPVADASADRLGRQLPAVLYPNCYVWYVFFAALDVMLTWVILHLGGHEINIVADRVIARWDLPGLAVFKFGLVAVVVCICEVVGRRRAGLGRTLATWAVALAAVPVAVGLIQLILHFHR